MLTEPQLPHWQIKQAIIDKLNSRSKQKISINRCQHRTNFIIIDTTTDFTLKVICEILDDGVVKLSNTNTDRVELFSINYDAINDTWIYPIDDMIEYIETIAGVFDL